VLEKHSVVSCPGPVSTRYGPAAKPATPGHDVTPGLRCVLLLLQGIDSFAADQKKLEEQLAKLAATL
jgi:hypothetical protein